MKTVRTRKRRADRERDIKRQIDEIVSGRVRQTLRAAGLSPDSAPRRRHERLFGRVVRMFKGPVRTWRPDLLDEFIDAEADIRSRLRAVELYARMQASGRSH